MTARGYKPRELADLVRSGQARLLRLATGRSSEAAARDLDIGYRALLEWERGLSVPQPKNASRYFAYLLGLRNQHGIVEIAGADIRDSVEYQGNMDSAAGEADAGQDLAGAAVPPLLDGAGAGNAQRSGAGCQDRAGLDQARAAVAPDIRGAGQA